MKELDEKNMDRLESLIPKRAEDAVKQARLKHLAAGRTVVEAVDGQLIETFPDGTFRVIKALEPPTRVLPGQRRMRLKG